MHVGTGREITSNAQAQCPRLLSFLLSPSCEVRGKWMMLMRLDGTGSGCSTTSEDQGGFTPRRLQSTCCGVVSVLPVMLQLPELRVPPHVLLLPSSRSVPVALSLSLFLLSLSVRAATSGACVNVRCVTPPRPSARSSQATLFLSTNAPLPPSVQVSLSIPQPAAAPILWRRSKKTSRTTTRRWSAVPRSSLPTTRPRLNTHLHTNMYTHTARDADVMPSCCVSAWHPPEQSFLTWKDCRSYALSHPFVSHSEHFCYPHGKHGPLHAEPLQQQNLVSAVTQCSSLYLTYSELIF